jgi:hypothetical protein
MGSVWRFSGFEDVGFEARGFETRNQFGERAKSAIGLVRQFEVKSMEQKSLLEKLDRKQKAKTGELKTLIPNILSGVIFSLDFRDTLDSSQPQPENFRAENYFHGQKIVGAVTISKEKTEEILEQMLLGLEEESPAWMCFYPRHGFKVVFESSTVEFLICFECGSLWIYDHSGVNDFLTGTRANRFFYNILKENRIPEVQ